MSYVLLGLPITQPVWFLFDALNSAFTINSSSQADVGIYTITTTVSIPQVNPSTSVNWTTNFSFTLTVIDDCTLTTFADKTITDMSMKVSQTAVTQDITFADSTATSHTITSYCGARTYTLSPALGFLSISGTTLTLNSSNPADVSVTSVTLTIGLTNYAGVSPLVKTFTVTITCEVISLAFSTSPVSTTTIQVGITALPVNIPYTVTLTPNCANSASFVFAPATPAILSLMNLNATGGDI